MAGAVLAAGAILLLASHGRRPEPGLVRFEAAGIMQQIRPEEVAEVIVSMGRREWRFARAGSGDWASAGGAVATPVATHLDRGLRFLYASAPQRILEPAELSGIPVSDFGLDPPRYSVLVRSRGAAAPFRVDFGSRNPQGLAQYARVPGRAGVLLLPAFVGEPWEAAIEAR